MSSKKIPLQKAYISSSSQQQQQKRHPNPTPNPRKIQSRISINKMPPNTDYSVLDQISLKGDLVKPENSDSDNDELRILDQESQSSDYRSEDGQSNSDLEEPNYTEAQLTSRPPSQPVSQLHPLQKKRLQILQKLQQQDICSPEEYQSIVNKLQQQNEKLQSDLDILRQKVDLLRLKQMRKNKEKSKTQTQNKRYPEEEYKRMKAELKKKYKELQKLQKKSSKSTTSFALQIQYRQFVNKLIQLENTCQTLRQNRKDEKKIHKNLKNQLKKYGNSELPNSAEAQQLQTYNKELKNKLFLMKKILSSQEQSELQIHKFNIQMKQRQKKAAQILRIQEVNRRAKQRKEFGRKTRLATVGGDVQKLQTKFGTMKLYTMDSKVRARTEFSFQDKELESKLEEKLLLNRNQSALTQIADGTPRSLKKSSGSQSPIKKSLAAVEFIPLTSQEITYLVREMNEETQNLQILSGNLQKRLSFLQEQLQPNFKRQGSSYVFSKQKDMMGTKNKLLIQELKSVYNKKIELMREYNIVERYYGNGKEQTQGQRGMYKSTQNARNQSNPTRFPRISQVNDFNRSRSEMKFNKAHTVQKTQILNRPILSAGKSMKNRKVPTQNETNVKKSPSMPTYNNGRSQTIEKKLSKEEKEKIKKQKQKQEEQKRKIQCREASAQANLNFSCFREEANQAQIKSNNWRQDFVGQIFLEESHFDDRIYAAIDQNMHINELTVHHTENCVLFVQAKYKSATNSSYSEQLTTQTSYKLPSETVQANLSPSSVIVSTTELSVNDYIKQIKVFYHHGKGSILKLQVVSKFNVKYDFGSKSLAFPTALSPYLNLNTESDKDNKKRSKSKNNIESKKGQNQQQNKQLPKFYSFDIKPNEYPGFMFGNYSISETGNISLSGLGFTIHKQKK